MQIDEKLFKKLERLSQLEIEEEKRELVQNKFSQMLTFITTLDEISNKLDKVEIQGENSTPFREDTPAKSDVIDQVFAHAPQAQDGFFLVPKIIE